MELRLRWFDESHSYISLKPLFFIQIWKDVQIRDWGSTGLSQAVDQSASRLAFFDKFYGCQSCIAYIGSRCVTHIRDLYNHLVLKIINSPRHRRITQMATRLTFVQYTSVMVAGNQWRANNVAGDRIRIAAASAPGESGLRQCDSPLALVFAAPVLVRRFTLFIGLEE